MASDVYEVKAIGADPSGNQWQCTSHWLSAALTPTIDPYGDAGLLCAAYMTFIDNAFLACVPGDVNQHYIYARRVNNGGGNANLLSDPTAGTWSNNVEVIGIGAQLRFVTASPKVVGKMFLPGVAPGMFAADTIQPAYDIVLDALLAVLITGLSVVGNTYLQVVWTRPQNGPPPVPGVVHNVINWDYADKPGSQRKRMTPLF